MTDTPTSGAEATLADRITEVLDDALDRVDELAKPAADATNSAYGGLPAPVRARIRSEVLNAVRHAIRRPSPERARTVRTPGVSTAETPATEEAKRSRWAARRHNIGPVIAEDIADEMTRRGRTRPEIEAELERRGLPLPNGWRSGG